MEIKLAPWQKKEIKELIKLSKPIIVNSRRMNKTTLY